MNQSENTTDTIKNTLRQYTDEKGADAVYRSNKGLIDGILDGIRKGTFLVEHMLKMLIRLAVYICQTVTIAAARVVVGILRSLLNLSGSTGRTFDRMLNDNMNNLEQIEPSDLDYIEADIDNAFDEILYDDSDDTYEINEG